MLLSRSFRHRILYDKHLYKAIYFETVCDGICVSMVLHIKAFDLSYFAFS